MPPARQHQKQKVQLKYIIHTSCAIRPFLAYACTYTYILYSIIRFVCVEEQHNLYMLGVGRYSVYYMVRLQLFYWEQLI